MRQSRMKLAAETAVYHLMSRTSRVVLLFNDTEKEKMWELLWKVARFCGVEVITYALMSNHFHLLVRVPEKTAADANVTDEELMNRAAELRNDASMDLLRLFHKKHLQKQAALVANPEAVVDASIEKQARMWEVNKAELLAQMHDLSIFMKMFKQRVSMSYNKRHETLGRLWADRFKSQLVEDRSSALQIVSAYIDLNGVRAGLADDPKDYRFCGYAEAMSGNVYIDGAAIGGRGFVEKVFTTHRSLFGPKRESGATPIRGAQREGLKVLRDLRTKVFGVPKS